MLDYFDTVYSVSQLNRYLKDVIDSDGFLKQITIKGELSNFTNHLKTGHFYFSLKDQNCSIKAVMFRTYAHRVRFRPENGMSVVLTGSVRVFERDGALQFYCERMEPDGIGALTLAFEQLKERLAKEGLFAQEHKKPIPVYPKRIGVVTSKTGAALQDILNILSRRYPVATVVLIPALVQGENAAASVCEGIALAEEAELDVLIVGRGGGSIEDLWCFNEECVARAIYQCTVPVISAVGHEIDFTIADFAADLRAPTPSAAAELCAPDIRDLIAGLGAVKEKLDYQMKQKLQQCSEAFTVQAGRLERFSPQRVLEHSQERLNHLSDRLERAQQRLLEQKQEQAARAMGMLDALSPLKVFGRGYSAAYVGETLIRSAKQVQAGDTVRTRLTDGEIYSTVMKTTLEGKE